MRIAVLANDAQWEEMINGAAEAVFERVNSLDRDDDTVTAWIILEKIGAAQLSSLQKPVLLNAVENTITELGLGSNIVRINGWNGFLSRRTWELAGMVNDTVKEMFVALKRQYIIVTDEPGLAAVRTIAMIINEAYFALGESVSTKTEIDTAMKLGTNYPYGPFEWAEKIGIGNIYTLLLALNKTDNRYLPAPLLQKEATA